MLKNLDTASQKSDITSKRRVLGLQALAIGLVSGLIAVAFRLSLEHAEVIRNDFLALVQARGGVFLALPPVIFGLLVMGVVFITTRYAPDASGSGIPHLKGYLSGVRIFQGWRILFAKFLGGVIGIGSGLALGREGPTVQMGAAVAKIVGDKVAPSRVERKILISAGAGAGLSAAFNAPMAGLFFVLEELHSSFHQAVLITAFVASITADIVCRLIVGKLPVFHIQISSYPEVGMVPYFILLGGLIGFLGLIFNKTLLNSSDFVYRLTSRKKLVLALLTGAGLGVVGLFAPESIGTGGELISSALSSRMLFRPLLAYFILRFVFTMLSYSTGAPGGIFAPLLLLGVLAGSFFGDIVTTYSNTSGFDFSVWAVLGMAGFFSSVVRAPITGTILILEMTGAYDLLLPLMIVSIIAYSIPEFFKDKPIYEALLHRDLERRG